MTKKELKDKYYEESKVHDKAMRALVNATGKSTAVIKLKQYEKACKSYRYWQTKYIKSLIK